MCAGVQRRSHKHFHGAACMCVYWMLCVHHEARAESKIKRHRETERKRERERD